jgi:hypothetical protein
MEPFYKILRGIQLPIIHEILDKLNLLEKIIYIRTKGKLTIEPYTNYNNDVVRYNLRPRKPINYKV